jgi:hypothetical protein
MDQNLMWALALLGAVVLIGVVAHGAWASRKADPKRVTEWYKSEPTMGSSEPVMAASGSAAAAEKAVSAPSTTARVAAQTAVRTESPAATLGGGQAPMSAAPASLLSAAALALSASPAAAVGKNADLAATIPGVLETPQPKAISAATDSDPPRPAKKATPRLDALIDVITNLTLEKAMSGDALLAHWGVTQRIGSKPFLVEGLNTARGEWEPLAPGQLYSELQVGVQLANRRGAINNIEYSEYVQKINTFADEVNATVDDDADDADMREVVARARELDTFAAEHDAHLAVRLQSRGTAWSVSYVQQHAMSLGFALGSVAGRLVWPAPSADGAPPVLILSLDAQAALAEDPNQSVVREATLGFDVPQTSEQAEPKPFTSWKTQARALAEKLEARLTDDQGQPLDEEGFASIEEALQQLYTQLTSRDLAAGTAAARRLFS